MTLMATKQVSYSSFLRGPSAVLPALDEGDVILERRDAGSLVLTSVERFEARSEGIDVASRALHELFSSDPERAEETMSIAIPWLHWLPVSERRDCIADLVRELDAGASTGNFEPFARSLVAWKSTAEVWSDPELARQLSGAFPGDGSAIERPAVA